jgi:CubicO group peptidase (beta-lactamase class C family)
MKKILLITILLLSLITIQTDASESSDKRVLDADTPSTTIAGNTFIAPAGWSIYTKGKATIVEAPEGDSRVVLVDVEAKDADGAVAEAWAAYRPELKLPLKSKTPSPDKDGWQDQFTYDYQTSPNERRTVLAGSMRHGEQWSAWIYDFSQPVAEKRLAAVALIFGRLLPKGYSRESFADRKANMLDEARTEELIAFVKKGQELLGVPGVSIGIVQNGKTVLADGFGVRELGKTEKPDANTLYIIASNTKALTTLMLGKLVDQNKLTWDTPVTKVLPQFKLGDADTTKQVLIKHLICACTGLPRQDFEWLLEFENGTAATTLETLGTMQPTSKFGEMYQYSNPLAAAGGYVGAYLLFPDMELGAAYDQAMKTLVFNSLGMTSTTFDFKQALGGNHAAPHAFNIDGKTDLAVMDANYSILPVRPAGGAWSNVNDMLKYVSMELAKGVLPNGDRYISEKILIDRKTPQVSIGKDDTYGMGLSVNTQYSIPVVDHGGSMIGYKSNMIWLPDHNVGAVILTNSDLGFALINSFRRKLLELLFDGKPEADNDVAVAAKSLREQIAAERKLLTVPPDKTEVSKLASSYSNPALGDINVSNSGDTTIFDFGEWKTPIASRKNPDGTVSFMTTVPGFIGMEFVVGSNSGKKTLTFRDMQHEYVFEQK